MLSNCSLWHKLQHSRGDIQSLSTSSESFNPGRTQRAHQQRGCQQRKPQTPDNGESDAETGGKSTALLASGGGSEERHSISAPLRDAGMR